MLLDPMEARVRASSIDMWEATGRCLQFVNWAYGEPSSRMTSNGRGTTPDGAWRDAKEGWYGSLHQHPGDGADAPAGVPVYWETGPSGNPAGHIVISDGDGFCYTTDYAGPRSVSRQSIAYLNRLRGTALGWTEDFGGNPIAGITTQPNGGFLMALSDTQQQQVYDALVVHSPGGDYYQPAALINILRDEVLPAIAMSSLFPGQPYNGFAAIINELRGKKTVPVDIDEKALAAELAPALAPLIAENAGKLSDETVAALVKALLDEQSKRLAS